MKKMKNNVLRNVALWLVLSWATMSYAMSRECVWSKEKHPENSLSKQKMHVLYSQANRMPSAQTDPISIDLQKSLLTHSPKRIKSIVNAWKKVDISKRDSYAQLPKKWLFIGNCGMGKTEMGKAIAAECGMPYFKYASIVTSARNSGVINLKRIFTHVASLKKPCVIIFDEIGMMFRQHHNSHDESSMPFCLWDLLDQYKEEPILVIGTTMDTTDDPQLAEKMFKDHIVEFTLPDESQREQVILYYMNHFVIPVDIAIARKCAKKTKGYSYRTLETLVVQSANRSEYRSKERYSTPNPTQKDYDDTLERIKETRELFNPKQKKSNKTWCVAVASLATLAMLYLGYQYYYKQSPAAIIAD